MKPRTARILPLLILLLAAAGCACLKEEKAFRDRIHQPARTPQQPASN